MGYALFGQRKLVLDSQLNTAQLEQMQRANEQMNIATNKLSLGQQLSSMQASQSQELANHYKNLSAVGDNGTNDEATKAQRDEINAKIKEAEEKFKAEIDGINQEIYKVGVQENAIEMEVKRLDTMVTALDKQMQAVEQAEGAAIERATPKFRGVG